MTSCSYYHYASVSSLRRKTVGFFHRYQHYHHYRKSQTLLIQSKRSQSSSVSFIFGTGFTNLRTLAKSSSPVAECISQHHLINQRDVLPGEENRFKLREGRDKINSLRNKRPLYSSINNSSQRNLNMLPLCNRLLHSDLFLKFRKSSVQLKSDSSSEISACSTATTAAGTKELCSFLELECDKNPKEDLKIAPFGFRTLSNDIPLISGNLGRSMPNISQVKVDSSLRKEGESSWKSFCEVIKLTSDIDQENEKSFLRDENNGSKTFQKLNSNALVTSRKGHFGKRAMSLSLLLDPIVGSPPSNFTSPTIEARDDISALSEGFTRKVNLLRRRLSTSFDEPIEGVPASIQKEGSFASKSPSSLRKLGLEEDHSEKKAKLNAWLTKLHEEALFKTRNNSNESSGDTGGNSTGFSDDGDDGEHHPKPAIAHSNKVPEDLYHLLEKVIGFKGRNVSHITVEQSVKDLCTVYMDASEEDKLKFFTTLAQKYGVDHDHVVNIAANLASCTGHDVKITLEEKLRGSLVPKSQWLFTQIGRLENGVKFLVDLRTDLLDAIEKAKEKSSLKALNNSVRDLIGMWFNVGFLNLERVTWQSSCDMLQKISEYEAVHPMRNWTDLKKRVGPNRRCFVFTHNSMPGEPVVVLHTFLTDHIPSSVQKIVTNQKIRMMSLDSDLPMTSSAEDPDSISTAAFYSITSTQRGLTGIELGNYLIKRVVRELQSEFPKMTQYSSLSPIPGFKNWLVSSIRNTIKEPSQPLLTEHEINVLKPIFASYGKEKDFYQVFLDLLKVNSWFTNDSLVKELENPLMRLCAQYLYIVKRRGYALNPVAHFHLKNGAVLWRINWLGDKSPRGLGQSCGMMVNYRYFLDDCEKNSQNYLENQVIQISDQVKHLVKLTNPSQL